MRSNVSGQGSKPSAYQEQVSPNNFSAINTSMHMVGNETGDASLRNL